MAEGEIEAVAAELRLSGRIASEIDDLAPVGTAMGRSMGGRAEATAAGALSLPSGAFDVELLATARDLRTGTAALDALLGAEARLEASLRRDAEGMAIDRFQVAAADLDLDGRGHLTSAGGAFSATAHIADLGRVAPGVAGEATATLRGKGTPEGWDIEASAAGPGGASATAAGRAFLPGGRHDLEVDARFPLALVGRLVAPRRLGGEVSATLRLRGPAMLSAVSGRAALRDGSLSAPALRLSLEAIEGTASLSEGTARIAVRGRGREGGQLSLGGDLNIATPSLPASLQLELDRLVVRDRLLFDTEATGRLSATGNLLQHIDITGRIELGKTEVRIAPVGGGAAPLPPLRHVGAPPEVRRTLRYAGVDERTTESAPLPVGLDIVVAAPRLFLRGYGVDAEFGGRVRLGGTLGDVVPAGGFDLVRGRLSILGRRFDLLEGTLRSRGSFTPDIHLVAEAESADGIVARIQLSGPADAPELTVTSDPPLPEEEALAHLFFARGSANLSPLQAFRLAGALASLSGHESAAERLRLGFGLDNLDIRQDTDTTTFALGKYVTDNAYTEITVDTEGRSTISLNVDVGRNLTAKARLSDDRETGFGIFWQRDY
ncbi:MAG: hypothetical protein D6688_08285 [Alphaproteobacteria bacterium]|nr:MAG: hypothetical protein D6688_08285 [Alphaproteobacteria bacterium]